MYASIFLKGSENQAQHETERFSILKCMWLHTKRKNILLKLYMKIPYMLFISCQFNLGEIH